MGVVNTISWDPNTEPGLAGYKVYMGRSSMTFDVEIDVGNVTCHEITTPEGVPMHFAVKAYDAAGNHSDSIARISQRIEPA